MTEELRARIETLYEEWRKNPGAFAARHSAIDMCIDLGHPEKSALESIAAHFLDKKSFEVHEIVGGGAVINFV